MTPQEWIAKYSKLGQSIGDKRVIFLATTGTMSEMSDRIWGQGGLSNGGTIKYNEDYELYAYKPPAPRAVTGRGKPYDQWKRPAPKKGTSAKIKGGFYPTYLAFKEQQGRRELPFELTGAMRKSWLGGATPTPTAIDPLTCAIVMDGESQAKADGLTASKGAFLLLTAFEKKSHTQRVLDIYKEQVIGR